VETKVWREGRRKGGGDYGPVDLWNQKGVSTCDPVYLITTSFALLLIVIIIDEVWLVRTEIVFTRIFLSGPFMCFGFHLKGSSF